MVVQVAAVHLLVHRAGRVVHTPLFSGLQAHIHEKKRYAQREHRDIVVIPKRLHAFIGLCATHVISAIIHVVAVLVEGQDGVHLVSEAFIAHAKGVVRAGRIGKVVGADDTFIVIGKGNAAHLRKQAEGRRSLYPALVQAHGQVAVHAPDSVVLEGQVRLEPLFVLVVCKNTDAAHDKGRAALRGQAGAGQAAGANFTVCKEVKAHVEAVLHRVRLGACLGERHAARQQRHGTDY